MATVYKCDGCDKEFKTKSGNLIEIMITTKTFAGRLSSDAKSIEDFDFCNKCHTAFRQSLNHLTTVRAA